ncbi:MAG: RDD family protein [Flavobacterium sp.]|nr:RDD family protein [Flavobacterium sp.]MBP8157467.1 RDD family protein [Flavobacterium sp.]
MSQLSINTTQNVVINFSAASVGERIGAYMLDFLVKAAYFIIIYYVFFSFFQIDRWLYQLDNWSQMAVYMIFFLPIAFYSLVQESLLEGQTLGKRLVKIKVVKIDGYQASFGDYLIRWLFRVIDISLGSGIIGLIAMVVNNKTQRLGDMSAGTAVITLKHKATISSTILEEIGDEYQPKYPLVIKLSDNDARIIKETFHTAMKSSDFVVLNKLTTKIEQVTGIKNELGSTKEFIQIILKDYNYYTQNM